MLRLDNKVKTFAISLVLLLAFSSFVIVGSFAKTYTAVPPRPTQTVVGVSPTLIGIGQQVLINIMTSPPNAGPTFYQQNLVNVFPSSWLNVTCTITLPDGTQNTFMPIDSTLAHIGVNIPGAAQSSGFLQFY
jgi:hypothetical protein